MNQGDLRRTQITPILTRTKPIVGVPKTGPAAVKGHAHAFRDGMPRAHFCPAQVAMAERSSDEEFEDVASFDAEKTQVGRYK